MEHKGKQKENHTMTFPSMCFGGSRLHFMRTWPRGCIWDFYLLLMQISDLDHTLK